MADDRLEGVADAARVEHQEQAFAFHELRAEIQVRADALRAERRTVQLQVRNLRVQTFPQLPLQPRDMRGALRQIPRRNLRRNASADDGRGHLSERALWDFCEFTLRTMVDQIAFMERLLDLDGLEQRIEHYVHVAEPAVAKDADKVFLLLREALFRGQFARGEAGRIVGTGERTGRDLLGRTIAAGLLTSESPKTPVSLALPAKVLDSYFPQLFPLNPVGGDVR